MQHTFVTSGKELNDLIYGSSFYIIIYRSYKLLKAVKFFAHPVLGAVCH